MIHLKAVGKVLVVLFVAIAAIRIAVELDTFGWLFIAGLAAWAYTSHENFTRKHGSR